MQYLKTYLNYISEQGNHQLAESINKTASDIGNEHIKKFSFISHEIGLLFGNVQSGKTGQMFGVICKAADLGFPVFVILTTDNIVLQQQTLERVKSDLKGFCICGENDGAVFQANSLIDPVIIVLKKNSRVLKQWSGVLNSTGFMKGNPLFIIDDEADAASLNNLVNRNRQSTINKYLDTIKNGASSSIYLQVTGTPQAILLQRDLDNPARSAVIHHICASSQILAPDGKVCTCLIHPSVRHNIHEKYAAEVTDILEWCRANAENAFKQELFEAYNEMNPKKSDKIDFDALYSTAVDLISNNKIKILVMNGKNSVSSDEYSTGSNIVIGGNTLGRGVTFPGLHTIYYTRTSKKPQADTMWQHSRMFGYDRDGGLMRVFIDEPLYKLFSDINSTNNSIIAQIENGSENIKVFYPDGLNPTRPSVLDNDKVFTISGGTNYYPFNPDNNTIEELDTLMKPFDESVPFYQVNLRLIKEIFKHITSGSDFKISSFVSALDTISADKPHMQGVLIVRRNRDVAKGTGALLSPNDWKLGASFDDKVVLTMYKVTGRKGWNGKQLWIPNIKLPNGIVYYDLEEN